MVGPAWLGAGVVPSIAMATFHRCGDFLARRRRRLMITVLMIVPFKEPKSIGAEMVTFWPQAISEFVKAKRKSLLLPKSAEIA